MSSTAHRGPPADRGTWRAETGGPGWGNQELRYYTGEPGHAALDGAGNLAIVVRRVTPELARQRYGGCGYTSARLISRDRGSFRYGLIQARTKIPRARRLARPVDAGPGHRTVRMARLRRDRCHGAFWHRPGDGTPDRPRAGILRARGWFSASRGRPVARPRLPRVLGRPDPGQIAWYVSNDLYHAVTPADLNGKPWVFDHEFFLLLNVAVGGTAPGPAR
jgi:hypothetical protein